LLNAVVEEHVQDKRFSELEKDVFHHGCWVVWLFRWKSLMKLSQSTGLTFYLVLQQVGHYV
jgi:hypothetical protein